MWTQQKVFDHLCWPACMSRTLCRWDLSLKLCVKKHNNKAQALDRVRHWRRQLTNQCCPDSHTRFCSGTNCKHTLFSEIWAKTADLVFLCVSAGCTHETYQTQCCWISAPSWKWDNDRKPGAPSLANLYIKTPLITRGWKLYFQRLFDGVSCFSTVVQPFLLHQWPTNSQLLWNLSGWHWKRVSESKNGRRPSNSHCLLSVTPFFP